MKRVRLFFAAVLLCACSALLAGCGSEPDNLHDMFMQLGTDYQTKKPLEKSLALLQKFGAEGLEGLIRMDFAISHKELPYYQPDLEGRFKGTPSRRLVEKLSSDPAFLATILDVSTRCRKEPSKNITLAEYVWVLSRNPDIFLTWMRGLDETDWRVRRAWQSYFSQKPDQAFAESLEWVERRVGEGKGAADMQWLRGMGAYAVNRFARPMLSPERLRFLFTNGLDSLLFQTPLPFAWWLEAYPEDFGRALWRKNPRKPEAWERFTVDEKDFPRSAVTPTREGGRVMVFIDTREAAIDSRKIGAYGVKQCRVGTDLMRDFLQPEVAATSLKQYDRQVVLGFSPVMGKNYYSAESANRYAPVLARGVRWKITVTYSEVQSGKVLAEKSFLGEPPSSQAVVPVGTKFVEGNVPWAEATAYLRELFPAKAAGGAKQ